MWESIMKLVKRVKRKPEKQAGSSKDAAKERLHLVLMQDRANVSADFLELMKQEIIEVIKKYIEIDESAIDVRLTNKENSDGTNGAPALYANIPIMNIKDEVRQKSKTNTENTKKQEIPEEKVEKVEEEQEEKEIKQEEVKLEENKAEVEEENSQPKDVTERENGELPKKEVENKTEEKEKTQKTEKAKAKTKIKK